MFSTILMCFATFMLFNQSDGRFHHRNKLLRRQNVPMPPPNMMQGSYPAQPVPPAYEMPPNPIMSSPNPPPPSNERYFLPPLPPPANPPVSSGPVSYLSASGQSSYPGINPNYAASPPVSSGPASYLSASGQAPYPGTNPNYGPSIKSRAAILLSKRANLFRKNVRENSHEMKNVERPKMLHSRFNPPRERIERRRKSVLGKKNSLENGNKVHRHVKPASAKRKTKDTPEKKGEMEKLMEEGKKMLEMPTESKLIGDESSSKSLDNFFEGEDEMNGNVTVIPIPKGIQLKSDSDKDNKHVKETVNITSSTQKTVSFDNNTEIESVMEMEMEKKIEDEKGDSKGSEEVKIVETERVKPIMIKKGHNSLSHKHRKRRFPLRKLFKQHRGRRSTTHSASFYSKMMKKFLSDLKREDRNERMTGLLNQIESTTPGQSDATTKATNETDWGFTEEKRISVKDKSVYDSDEMEEFLKQILAQLVKLRKTRYRNKLKNKDLQYSSPSQKDNYLNFTRHRKKNHDHPKHNKMVMNSNRTWDDEFQQLKGENKPEWSEDIPVESRLMKIVTLSPIQRAFTIYLNDKRDTNSRFLVVVIIVCMMTFLLPILLCFLHQKLKERSSACPLCPFESPDNHNKGEEGICRFPRENFATEEYLELEEEYLELEWQSETGEWVSEKDIEFK